MFDFFEFYFGNLLNEREESVERSARYLTTMAFCRTRSRERKKKVLSGDLGAWRKVVKLTKRVGALALINAPRAIP